MKNRLITSHTLTVPMLKDAVALYMKEQFGLEVDPETIKFNTEEGWVGHPLYGDAEIVLTGATVNVFTEAKSPAVPRQIRHD